VSLPEQPTQWTVTLAPAAAAPAPPTLRARARRWGLTAFALLAAYWIGTANTTAVEARPPAPAYTQPATITVHPDR
jgi:hypothetical protein